MDQTIFQTYNKTYGARFSGRQKGKVRTALIEEFKALGYSYEIITGRRFLTRANNVLFGNLKHAKTVIAIPYDTPQKVFWPKSNFFPLDGMATNNNTLLPTFGPVLVLYLILLGAIYGLDGMVSDIAGVKVAMAVILLLVILLFYLMLHGMPNKHNASRNTAGIVAAIEIAKRLDKDTRRTTAFLFVDQNKSRHLGARIAAEDFLKQSKNPNIIVLNTFAKGSQIQIGYNPQNKKLAQELNKSFANAKRLKMVGLSDEMRSNSAMEHFAKAVTIGAGEIDKKGRLCVMGTGTSKDDAIDEENVDTIVEMVTSYLK